MPGRADPNSQPALLRIPEDVWGAGGLQPGDREGVHFDLVRRRTHGEFPLFLARKSPFVGLVPG